MWRLAFVLLLTGCATVNYEDIGDGRFLHYMVDQRNVYEQYEYKDAQTCRANAYIYHNTKGLFGAMTSQLQCSDQDAKLPYVLVFSVSGSVSKMSTSYLHRCHAVAAEADKIGVEFIRRCEKQ